MKWQFSGSERVELIPLWSLGFIKIHHKRPIKIYGGQKTQLAQKLFSFTIIILMKQRNYYQYVLAKKRKQTYSKEQYAQNYPC